MTLRRYNNTYFWFTPVINLRECVKQLDLSFYMPVIATIVF